MEKKTVSTGKYQVWGSRFNIFLGHNRNVIATVTYDDLLLIVTLRTQYT